MSVLDFQKPDKIVMVKSTDSEGTFEFRPLEMGFGLTIGNALRRVILSSLEGAAITSLRIDGVKHEFSTISGVVEDVSEIILNLKKVRFKQCVEGANEEEVRVSVSGKDKVVAGDIQEFMSNFEVLNSDLVICNLDECTSIDFFITVSRGRGYVPSDENKLEDSPIGTIAIDSIHTPIKNVKYSVDNYRVEQRTDYEKLILEVETDGSISPKDALREGARILIDHFGLVSDENSISVGQDEIAVDQVYDEEALHMRQLFNSSLLDMDLSVRALNCLKAAEVDTLGDLVRFRKEDLMKFRNFGKKSLTELENLVKDKNLEFGMDLSKYGIEDRQ